MSSSSRRIGFLAPMQPELRPLVRHMGLERRDDHHEATIGDVDVVALLTRIGTAPARDATERLLDRFAVDHVVVSGIAGGVPGRTAIGDLLVPAVVIDGATGAEHRAAPLGGVEPSGRIRTADDLTVDAGDLDAHDIDACDMETSAVAAVCEDRGVPWTAFRAISDMVGGPVDDDLLRLANDDGSPNLGASIRFLLTHPMRIPSLVRLGRDSGRAADIAARAAIAAAGLQP